MDGLADRDGLERARRLLAAHAARHATLTYSELRSRLALEGDLVPLLRGLAETEDEAGRGLLSAVVVQAESGRPGTGWYLLAARRGRDVSDREACWQAEIAHLEMVWQAERSDLDTVGEDDV